MPTVMKSVLSVSIPGLSRMQHLVGDAMSHATGKQLQVAGGGE